MTTGDSLAGGGTGQTPVHPDDLDGLRQRWIRTQGQLDEIERANLLEGTRWALSSSRTVDQLLDEAFVRELHRRCFGKVWSWAGTWRQRGTSVGIDWTLIAPAMRDLLADARLWLVDDPHLADLARLHQRFEQIHPFPNGNGRTGRLHVELIARTIGAEPPTWGAAVLDRDDYLESLRRGDRGYLDDLIAFIWA